MHIGNEMKIYGVLQMGGDPQIRLPTDYTFCFGVHVEDNELERVGIVNQASEIPIFIQIGNFVKNASSTLEALATFEKINPKKIFTPSSKRDLKKRVFYQRENFKPEKIKSFPFSWKELWGTMKYNKPQTLQVQKYIEKNLEEFYQSYFQEEIKEIKENLLKCSTFNKKFYAEEENKEVKLSKLQTGKVPLEDYKKIHQGVSFGCHDVLLEHKGGLLLVTRDGFPAKDVLWPIGGRVQRGVPSEDSLREKIKEECGLEVDGDLIYLGEGRTVFQTAPFEHGHGTDTTNERYFAKAKGKLNLNNLHKAPEIIKPKDYTPEFRDGLEEYVVDHMDLAMLFIPGMSPILHHYYLNGNSPTNLKAKYAKKILEKQKIL
jgi:hypothetical protein